MHTGPGRRPLLTVVGVAALAIVLAACAAGADTAAPGPHPAGFWLGLWQGFIAPVVLVVSFFRDDVGIYEIHNRGVLYDLGFVFGISLFFSGPAGGGSARRRRRTRQDA